MERLKEELRARGFELIETHISWVFLGPERVFKVKKALDLGFLDFSTLSQRKAACEAEVELNRRLAPEVYLGVVPIWMDVTGRHRLGGEPSERRVVEWAVEMKRLRASDAADQRLAGGRLGRADVERIARHLAAFHAEARTDETIARFGAREVIEGNVRENFEQTRETAQAFLSAPELAAIEAFQLGTLQAHEATFARRVAEGRVRDGHGDLRLEHVYLDDAGGLSVIDCIEFNQRFRYGDVCADLAFLSMDLEWHNRHDLAEALLAAYAAETGDFDLYSLVDFYESYRAYVRGKVSSLLARDESADARVRERAGQQARKYYLLAEACAKPPLAAPALYAVGGVIASGKSTVARALAAELSAPVIEADRTRKQLFEVAPTTPLHDAAFDGHYSPEATARVYSELLRRAERVLGSGRPAVLDASFRTRAQREAAAGLSARLSVPFKFVECVAPDAVCRARLAERERGPSVSDGRRQIFDAFVASWEPVEELPEARHVRLDTSGGPPEGLLARLGDP